MKILMIVAKDGFRDEEFKYPFEIFKKESIDVSVVSTERGECKGAYGMVIDADLSFSEFQDRADVVDSYSAMMIVGGFGAKGLVGLKELEHLIHSFVARGKIVSAICISPVVLVKAGVLKGKRATVWNGDGEQEKVLRENGVEFVNEEVIKDGKFITGRDPDSAVKFAKTLVEAIKELN